MNTKKLEEFVDDTSFLWFFGLVFYFGVWVWLLVWGIYEISLIIFSDEEKENNSKGENDEKTYI
jgi:hypothetical protein